MQSVVNFVSSLGVVELIVIFVVGAVFCYLLGSAPSLAGILVLVLSLLAALKVFSSANNILLTILVFAITGGVLTFFAFMGHERRKAYTSGFSSIKGMYEAEAAEENISFSSDYTQQQIDSTSEFSETNDDSPDWSYMVAHPLLGTVGTALPITRYEFKQWLLETPPLRSGGWTMEQLIEVEQYRLVEYCDRYSESEEPFFMVNAIYSLLENNVKSGDSKAIEAFGELYASLKEIEGIEP